MSRKIILIALALLIASLLFSYYSNEFPIGTYTHYQNIDNSVNTIATYLENAHYNVVTDGYVLNDELLIFNVHHIDVIFGDIGSKLKRATKANYWEYEAEYYSDYNNTGVPPYNPQTVFPLRYTGEDAWPEEMWYYSVQRDLPEAQIPNHPLNGLTSKYYIRCEEDLGEGFVIDTLLYHSKEQNLYSHVYGPGFHSSLQTYYVRYTMKIPNEEEYPTPGTEVCQVGLKLKRRNANDVILHEPLPFTSTSPNLIILTKQDFIDASAVGEEFGTFEFSLSRSWLNSNYNLGTSRVNLCPVIWYSDNGTLEIDNVIISDNIYEDLDNPSSTVITNIMQTLNNYISYQNICGFAGHDEPAIPQFRANQKVKNIVEGEGSKLMCCVNLRGWKYADQNGYPHHNVNRVYSYCVNPSQLMPDVYPSKANYIKWGKTDTSSKWSNFQGRLDKMSDVYVSTKNECLDKGSEFYPITQSFGERKEDSSGNFIWSGYLLPPSESQSVLCYLPLCYGADGIFYYVFENFYTPDNPYIPTNEDEPIHPDIVDDFEREEGDRYQVGLVNNFGSGWMDTPQYYKVQEANEKITSLGPIIKGLVWDGSKTATLMPESTSFDLINPVSNSVSMKAYDPTGIEQHTDYYEGYEGYVECSVYNDNQTDYFMLVNRRGNFPLDDFLTASDYLNVNHPNFPEYDTNEAFVIAEDQTVQFEFEGQALDNYVLLDMYNCDSYEINYNQGTGIYSSDIVFQAGEAMLLKFVSTDVPEVINQSGYVLSNVHVNHSITILENCSLGILENVTFDSDIEINVENNAQMFIMSNENSTKFDTDSKIKVYGDLYIYDCKLSGFDTWQGIECYEGGQVWIQNEATIEDADIAIFANNGEIQILNSHIKNCKYGICLHNSSVLEFISSEITLSSYYLSKGISIGNYESENDILISGTEESLSVIQGPYSGEGIYLHSRIDTEEECFICEYTEFKNLETGITHNTVCSTDHEIMNCRFEYCDIGIQLFGRGLINKIESCDFIDNGYAISQNTVQTKINYCKFNNNDIGIDYANSQPGHPRNFGVYNSLFGYYGEINDTDIRCSDTSPEVGNCIFKSTIGILSVNNSNVNASFDANNVFQNTDAHLMFMPDHDYFSSGILLYRGHNDFYDENYDFTFLSNYNGSEITINADGNWWEDFDVDINDEAAIAPPTIIADRMDPEPNVPLVSPPDNRFETASYEESLGNNDTALNSFKEILNDKLENEKRYWVICIDKVYNLSMILEEDINALLNYYEILYQSTPNYLTEEEKISLQAILKNYQKKCHIEKGEYQEAADIVVERINNPVSPVDSLFAVMQLETIYTLSEMDSIGRGVCVSTNYDKLAPKSLREHNQKHKDHWDEIYALLGIGENIENEVHQNVPPVPVLTGNYPNPFNPETKIVFSIPEDSKVNLSIYNIRGQKVRTLVNDQLEKGFHEVIWNSKDNNGKSVASGVYFYKFDVNGKTKGVKKMLLLK